MNNDLLLANASSEWDFRNFPNLKALERFLKAWWVIDYQGEYFEVWGD